MQDRVQRDILGEYVKAPVPMLLPLVARGAKRGVHLLEKPCMLDGPTPGAARPHPNVIAVPPPEHQVGIRAKAAGIAWRQQQVIVAAARIDRRIGRIRAVRLYRNLKAQILQVPFDDGGHGDHLIVVRRPEAYLPRRDACSLEQAPRPVRVVVVDH